MQPNQSRKNPEAYPTPNVFLARSPHALRLAFEWLLRFFEIFRLRWGKECLQR